MANKGKITHLAAALVVCLFVTNANAQDFKTSGSVAASEEDIKSIKQKITFLRRYWKILNDNNNFLLLLLCLLETYRDELLLLFYS